MEHRLGEGTSLLDVAMVSTRWSGPQNLLRFLTPTPDAAATPPSESPLRTPRVQDVIAIAVAVAAGAWIVRTLWRQLSAPACGKAAPPPGTDGFVPLDDLAAAPRKTSGRP